MPSMSFDRITMISASADHPKWSEVEKQASKRWRDQNYTLELVEPNNSFKYIAIVAIDS